MSLMQLGKYKAIVISIALFLILDASVLILNFYISFQISEDAVGVNLAGRQRMLSQRMVKSLLEIDYSLEDPEQRGRSLQELQLTLDLFDSTLDAFYFGGQTQDAAGNAVVLKRVDSPVGIQAMQEARVIWEPYRTLLQSLLRSPRADLSIEYLEAAIAYAKSNNLDLLRLMNSLTVDLENVATAKATRLRWIQTVGISMAIINFLIILFHFLGQLRENDKKLEEARQETTEILDTVNEGLFLVDKELRIGTQHSRKVDAMFGQKSIVNLPFEELMEGIISPKDMDTTKRFIGLLYREEVKSGLIGDLNPLKEIEVSITDESGSFSTRYYAFGFSRVYQDNKVKDILVTVTDISDRIRLSRELAATKEQNEQQIEMLTSILHANPEMLKMFVVDCYSGLQKINGLLKQPAKQDPDFKRKLQDIFREIHKLKGESGALGLESFESLAHEFENQLKLLSDNPSLRGDDFLSLVVQLDKLLRHIESMRAIAEKLEGFSKQGKLATQNTADWSHLYQLAETVAKRSGKQVQLVTSGLKDFVLSEQLKKLVNDISVQCIRNSIVHGIETPRERLNAEKQSLGRIDLRLAKLNDGSLEMMIRDDGRGLDHKRIRQTAIKTGQWEEHTLDAWDHKKIMSLIFEPGFSTQLTASKDAGRGVGMDLIRESVKSIGGKIRIATKQGRSTQFVITVPSIVDCNTVAA